MVRTTTAAASDVASGADARPVHFDPLFRDSKERVVEPPVLPAAVRFADTHAHLDMLHHPHLALARCAAHRLGLLVTVIDPSEDPTYTLGNLESWQAAAQVLLDDWIEQGMLSGATAQAQSLKLPETRAIVGCHPHNAIRYDPRLEAEITAALRDDGRVVGIGEIGLDYHYDNSPHIVQQRVFRRQIQLAHEHGVPIALHLREAHADGLRILQEEQPPAAGVLLHCFNLDYATLEPFLRLGCKVAFGGPLTFKKSDEVRAAAARAPLERIVTETDAPFMAPVPLRGTVCGPADVIFTAALLADLRSQLITDPAAVLNSASATATDLLSEKDTTSLKVAQQKVTSAQARSRKKNPTNSSHPSTAQVLETIYSNADEFFAARTASQKRQDGNSTNYSPL